MGWLGINTLAAHGIAMQLASITFMVHLGFSNVATIRAGNAIARRDVPHLERGALMATVMSLIFSAITIVVFVLWPEQLISLFMQPDEPARTEILAIGVGLLAMAALFQLVDGTQIIALGVLRGLQDTKVPLIMAFISYWIIGIPCSYVLGFQLGWGAIGIWAGLVIGLGVAAVRPRGRASRWRDDPASRARHAYRADRCGVEFDAQLLDAPAYAGLG